MDNIKDIVLLNGEHVTDMTKQMADGAIITVIPNVVITSGLRGRILFQPLFYLLRMAFQFI